MIFVLSNSILFIYEFLILDLFELDDKVESSNLSVE